ncbi:MAG: Asp-tRNA(Asn)/Glu-tRNA(Gln) amidotransferase subunit GatC [Myxococcales bacterium]|nr:Asp-tRNA(Asn)/Glu-tRNA(Gln) amidotransferase subunit GatC [Myxococcales bacterium]
MSDDPGGAGEPIDEAQTRRIAALCQLELDDEETARMTAELTAILRYVAELQGIDVEGVPPTAHGGVRVSGWRADEPQPSLPRDLVLGQAPRSDGEGFLVPSFVDSEGGG